MDFLPGWIMDILPGGEGVGGRQVHSLDKLTTGKHELGSLAHSTAHLTPVSI